MNEKIKYLRQKAMKLPLTPGVYLMKNSKNEIIYIGKAKALKNRVSSYFGSQKNHSQKVKTMVEKTAEFDYILTDSEFEALVLECSLIKQHMPKYNILLKDDKGYHYIKVTNGEWPILSFAMQKGNDDATYIGPYTSSFSVRQTVDEVQKIFKLPNCSKVFPRDIGKGRPCLNYYISQCSAPCSGKISKKDYNENVSEAIKYITSGIQESVKEMQRQMEEVAENLEFEKAAKLRDRIQAINKISDKQKVVDNTKKEQDIFAFAVGNERTCLMVLRFLKGRLYDSESFIFDDIDEDMSKVRHEMIRNYYSMREKVPPLIVVDGEVEDAELLMEWLTQKAGKKSVIFCPQRGEQNKLLEMCKANATEKLAQSLDRQGKEVAALEELAQLLGMNKIPEYIESYDISHTQGSDNVAGMVVFENGKPLKKAYKKFSIKGFSGQDDYASMAEVLERRFSRYEKEKETNEGFGVLPDLILLDGAAGQINAVLPVLKKYNLNIPIFGMVKDSRHKTRAIATSGGEIAINSKRKAFTLVSNIQEEVHRFSVAYHRNKHKKRTFSSTLTEIEGIGEAKAKELMKHFKTITAIKKAETEQLCQVKGISEKNAKNIQEYFKKEQ